MRRLVLVFAVVLLALSHGTAGAQPGSTLEEERPPWHERFSVGIGAHLGASDNGWFHAAFVADGAVRAPGVPAPFAIRGRGFVSLGGGTSQSDWSGNYRLVGGGIEILACASGEHVCGVGGVDVGHESADLTDGNSGRFEGSRSGPFVGPRFGIEAGFDRVRFRFIIDRYRWKTHATPSEWMSNGGVTFGVAGRF